MLLYNQKGVEITLDVGKVSQKVEPYGSIEVPEWVVEHVKLMGVPLSEVPVPPEHKAAAVAEARRAEGRSDEVAQLRGAMAAAEAEVKAARATIAEAQRKQAEAERSAAASEVACGEAITALKTAEADRDAAVALCEEQAKRVGELEAMLGAAAEAPAEKPKAKAKK